MTIVDTTHRGDGPVIASDFVLLPRHSRNGPRRLRPGTPQIDAGNQTADFAPSVPAETS